MKKHMKRLAAPRTWRLERKVQAWTAKPSPGPHPIERSVPIVSVLRTYLHNADNWREASAILNGRKVRVDGRIVSNLKFPVGLMDVLALEETKETHRMLLDRKGRLALVRIGESEATWKLARIEDKHTVKGGVTQLNLHDGRNVLLKKDQYKTRTTLKLQLPDQKILESYPLERGNTVLLIGGRHAGEVVHVDRLELTRNPKANLVYFMEGFSTIIDHVFVIGGERSEITLPEGAAL